MKEDVNKIKVLLIRYDLYRNVVKNSNSLVESMEDNCFNASTFAMIKSGHNDLMTTIFSRTLPTNIKLIDRASAVSFNDRCLIQEDLNDLPTCGQFDVKLEDDVIIVICKTPDRNDGEQLSGTVLNFCLNYLDKTLLSHDIEDWLSLFTESTFREIKPKMVGKV